MVTINGKEEQAEGKTILQYLQENGYKIERVVVEINLEIIPREKLTEFVLVDGDTVEILNFVGGG